MLLRPRFVLVRSYLPNNLIEENQVCDIPFIQDTVCSSFQCSATEETSLSHRELPYDFSSQTEVLHTQWMLCIRACSRAGLIPTTFTRHSEKETNCSTIWATCSANRSYRGFLPVNVDLLLVLDYHLARVPNRVEDGLFPTGASIAESTGYKLFEQTNTDTYTCSWRFPSSRSASLQKSGHSTQVSL